MGGKTGAPQPSGRGPRPGGRGGFGLSDTLRSIVETWQTSANEPITLRVPRGMALALMGWLLALLVLAYWVGYSRGGSAAEQRVTEMYQPSGSEGDRTPPGDRPGAGSGGGSTATGATVRGSASGAGQGGSPATQTPSDPRKPGLNYLILATYPEDLAYQLQAFMTDQGVEVMVGLRNNKGLCQVIALRGFTSAEYKAGLAETYRTEMLAHGRAWKAASQGQGDDLNTMYYDKYQPPDL